jgi:hypothetical protein
MNRRDALKTDVAAANGIPASSLCRMPTKQVFIPSGGDLWTAVLGHDAEFVSLGPPLTRNQVIARANAWGYEPVFLDETAAKELTNELS